MLNPEKAAWFANKYGDSISVEPMFVVSERTFEGRDVVLGVTEGGIVLIPRELVFQTRGEAITAAQGGKSIEPLRPPDLHAMPGSTVFCASMTVSMPGGFPGMSFIDDSPLSSMCLVDQSTCQP